MNPETFITDKSWLDLWNCIRNLKTSSVGLYKLDEATEVQVYGHTYQCNVMVLDEDVPSIDILFHPGTTIMPEAVRLIPVSPSGIADYNYNAQDPGIPINDPISKTTFDPVFRNGTEVLEALTRLLESETGGDTVKAADATTQVDPKAELLNGYRQFEALCTRTIENADEMIKQVQDSIDRVRVYRDSGDEFNTLETLGRLRDLNSLMRAIRSFSSSLEKTVDRIESNIDSAHYR